MSQADYYTSSAEKMAEDQATLAKLQAEQAAAYAQWEELAS